MTAVRYSAVAAFVAAAGLLASCGVAHSGASRPDASPSSRPWWTQAVVGNCGPAALVRLGGHVRGAGDCAGLLLIPAEKVTVDVGEQIDIHMLGIPLPHSTRPSVVMPGAIGPDRATATYRAVRSGHAALVSHTWACLVVRLHREMTRNCPVIDVTVVP
jgi:hypothetical protein